MPKKKQETKPEEPKAYVREKSSKELAVEKLLARGLNVTLESGVIMTKVKTPDELKIFKQAIKDIKYNSSYGAKIIREGNEYEAGRTVESIESEGSEDYS
jgi:uncharacterized protein YaaR (DUF327 family)